MLALKDLAGTLIGRPFFIPALPPAWRTFPVDTTSTAVRLVMLYHGDTLLTCSQELHADILFYFIPWAYRRSLDALAYYP